MKNEHLTIVPFWPLAIADKENYFLYPSLIAKKAGFNAKILVFSQKNIRSSTFQSIPLHFYDSLRKIVNEIPDDSFIHIHTAQRRMLQVLFFLILFKRKCRIIWTPHTSYGFKSGNPYDLPLDLYQILRFLFIKIYTIITISPKESLHLISLGYKNIKYIPLVITSDNFKKRNTKSVQKTFKFLFVGGERPVKGLLNTLKAFSIFVRDNPDCRLDVLGDVSKDFIKKNRRLISKNVYFHGQVEHLSGSFYRIFKNADYYINNSYCEGSPIAAGEAAASGLSLLLSNLETLKSIYKSNALYHNPNVSSELAKNMSIIYHQYQKNRVPNKSLRSLLEKMSFRNYSNLYNSLIS